MTIDGGEQGAGVVWGAGPRALEALLLEDLAAALEAGRRRGRWPRPIRVVVPSSGLRDHLSRALLERVGHALIGIRFQTLDSAVEEILGDAGQDLGPPWLYAMTVRAAAAREVALARTLGDLEDGYAAVIGVVDDLLDAGFTRAHAAFVIERLHEWGSPHERARAVALVRVAAAIEVEVSTGSLGHRSARLTRAAEILRDDPAALEGAPVFLHGFADATGAQLDFLEALQHASEARLYLDASASRFGERLRMRLAGSPEAPPLRLERAPEVTLSVLRDPEAEARAAVEWACHQLDAGAIPERVGIVVRDLSTHRFALRRQLRRAGVPFSGAGLGGATSEARRIQALLQFHEQAGRIAPEVWLGITDAWSGLALRAADARDACHVLGWVQLQAVADASTPARHVALPARRGFVSGELGHVERRIVSREEIAAIQACARASLEVLASASREAPFEERVAESEALLDALGWLPADPLRLRLRAALPSASQVGPRPIPRADWRRLLGRCWGEIGFEPLGGAGGGVQVLGVMDARARSFDALRVIGMNRGLFPRSVGEDALLPDRLRQALRDVLPDLPVKREGHEEERFLFEQLLGAAPVVTLSRASQRSDGRPASPSPLLERCVEADTGPGSPPPPEPSRPEPAAPSQGAWWEALSIEASRERGILGLDALSPAALAGRRAAVTALDFGRRGDPLPPHLGVVGPVRGEDDPRRQDPSITLLEALAKCPWRAFLGRLLRLEPVPDARAALPAGRDARLLGNVVHRALETVCDPDASRPWPASLETSALREAARRELRSAGVALPGYERALAARAHAYVEVARRLDEAQAAEIREVECDRSVELALPSGSRRVRFRADRADASSVASSGPGEERLRFTDWKTGKTPAHQARAESRAAEHHKRLRRGELLQAHAYAREGEGRFVYLDPELEDEMRVLTAQVEGEQRQAFEASVDTLFLALDAGLFFPRLREPDRDEEPGTCRFCEWKQACARGDSGARARLQRWAEREDGVGGALWRLPVADRT